jgi:hypothetical protein
MRLGEVNRSAFRPHESDGQQTEPGSELHRSDSRALVALAPSAHASEGQPGYRDAAFLAQLIATKDQHPQTRERRRADPTDVMAAYRATAALSHS